MPPPSSNWRLPPPEVQRQVAAQLGEGYWADLEASYRRLRLNFPEVNLTNWYRSPDDVIRVHRTQGGALFTQHGLGLAQDWLARNRAEADRLEAAGRREGFSVRRYPSKPLLVHLATLNDETWRRHPLRQQLERVIRERLRQVPNPNVRVVRTER